MIDTQIKQRMDELVGLIMKWDIKDGAEAMQAYCEELTQLTDLYVKLLLVTSDGHANPPPSRA